MTLRSAAVATVIFAVSAVFAQENAPASAPATAATSEATHPPVVTRVWGKDQNGNPQSGPVNGPTIQQRIDELQGTLDKMHVVLKQMRSKSAASAKDSMVKANLEMWDLVVVQLDKQLQELKQAEASRQDMEARRAAMYKQAEIKPQAAARAAQQAPFSPQPAGTVTAQPTGPGSNAQPPAAASQASAPSSAPTPPASPN